MTVITFVGAGRYSDVFKVTDGNKTVIMKLSYYRDATWCDFVEKMRSGDKAGAHKAKNQDSIMVSAAFGNATNDIIAKNMSPHFVYVYCHADCRNMAPRLKALIRDRVKTSSRVQLKFNNACFMEVFTTDMTKWLRTARALTDSSIRMGIFGVVYTLAVLQRVYPGFRHNDLSTNNVLVKKLRKNLKAKYTIDGVSYYVDVPVLVAISDYDFTHVPNNPKLTNERVVNGKYRVTATFNPTYDTHFLLKSVMKSLFGRLRHFPETAAFLNSLALQKEDRLDTYIVPGLEPDVLVRHSYFAPLRKEIGHVSDVYVAPKM